MTKMEAAARAKGAVVASAPHDHSCFLEKQSRQLVVLWRCSHGHEMNMFKLSSGFGASQFIENTER